MRRQTEWESGLSEQEKQLASYQRLLAVLRLIDIRAEVCLPLIDDIQSQEAYAAMVNGIMDQAWKDYVGVSVDFAPPMRDDPNYKMITDRGHYWIAASYDRADTTQEVANQPATPSPETPDNTTVFISYSWTTSHTRSGFLPEYEVKRYEGRVKDGGVLLSIHCDTSDEIAFAKNLFERNRRRRYSIRE
jgi:hypothetical protein